MMVRVRSLPAVLPSRLLRAPPLHHRAHPVGTVAQIQPLAP